MLSSIIWCHWAQRSAKDAVIFCHCQESSSKSSLTKACPKRTWTVMTERQSPNLPQRNQRRFSIFLFQTQLRFRNTIKTFKPQLQKSSRKRILGVKHNYWLLVFSLATQSQLGPPNKYYEWNTHRVKRLDAIFGNNLKSIPKPLSFGRPNLLQLAVSYLIRGKVVQVYPAVIGQPCKVLRVKGSAEC